MSQPHVSATPIKMRPQRPSSASVYLSSSSSARAGGASSSTTLASTFAGHRHRAMEERRPNEARPTQNASPRLQAAVKALQSSALRPQPSSSSDGTRRASPAAASRASTQRATGSLCCGTVMGDARNDGMWAATAPSASSVALMVPPIPTTRLARALDHMQRGDYGAAHRSLALMEPSMLRYVALGAAASADTRVATCKYLVNFGVCAATCGLLDRSAQLFDTALRVATQPPTSAGGGGLMGRMAEACRFNAATARRMLSDGTSNASDENGEAYAGDQRASADVASEFFLFHSEAVPTAAAPPPLPTASVVHQQAKEGTAAPPPPQQQWSSVRTANASKRSTAACGGCDLRVAMSLLSNARCLLQLDPSPLRQTKLCIMVTRSNLVEELGMYFSSMSREEIIRPIEMKVKGEGAIDGGYGGVTNDILTQFFSRTMSAFTHHPSAVDRAQGSSTSSTTSTATSHYPSNVWRAFGVLLVKSFVEGRSFASLRLLFSVRAWVDILLDGLSPPAAAPAAVAGGGEDEVDDAAVDAEDQRGWCNEPATQHDGDCDSAAYGWYCKAHEARQHHDEDSNNEGASDDDDSGVGMDLAAALRVLDQASGTRYTKGLAYYEQSGALWAEFVSLLPDWYPKRTMPAPKHSMGALVAAQQRTVYLWDKVVGSRLGQLLEMQRGVAFACTMVGDAVLRDALVSQQAVGGRGVPVAPDVKASARRLFAAVVCGGADAATITAKDVVGRLEFRGWAPEAKAPFLLCSWLHRATADEREGFVALCTGMTALPFEGDSGQAMPRIVVVRSDAHLYAKTCFFTLYLPSWQGVGEGDVYDALSAAVASLRHDTTMHEVDV